MQLKGNFDVVATYGIGDVVLFNDGFVYILFKECPAGTEPVDSRYWNKVSPTVQEAVILILSYNPTPNVSDDAILLKGESGDEYIITVDESGSDPELVVTPANDSSGEVEI